MKYVCRILILGFLVSGIACTKATPEFELLDPNAIPQPKFNGATVKNLTTGSGAATFGIVGECDPKITAISARAVNASATFSALSTVASSAPTVACSANGSFSFTLKSLTDLGFAPLVMGNTYEIQLKGLTSAGLSNASSIFILYSNGVGNPNMRVTGGGIMGGGTATYAADANFRAELSVTHVALTVSGTGGFPSDNTAFTFRPAGFAR